MRLHSDVRFPGIPLAPGNRRFGDGYLKAMENVDDWEERRRAKEARGSAAVPPSQVYEPAKDLGALVQEFGPDAAKELIAYSKYEQQGGVAGAMARMAPQQLREARSMGRRMKYEARARADQIVTQGFRESQPGQTSEGLSAILGERVEELAPTEATAQAGAVRRFRVGDTVMAEQGLRGAVERKLMERGRALGDISAEEVAVSAGAPRLPEIAPKLQHIGGNTFLNPRTNTAVDIPYTPEQQKQLNNKGWNIFSNADGHFVWRVKDGVVETKEVLKAPPKEKTYDKTVLTSRDAAGRETRKIVYTNPADPKDKFVAHEEVLEPKVEPPKPPPEAFGFETDADGKKHAVITRFTPEGEFVSRVVYPPGVIPKGYESHFRDAVNVEVLRSRLEDEVEGEYVEYTAVDKTTGRVLWTRRVGGAKKGKAGAAAGEPAAEPKPLPEIGPTDDAEIAEAIQVLVGQGIADPTDEQVVGVILGRRAAKGTKR